MSPKARRTNISLPETLYEAAQTQIPLHYCAGFSDYVATLIRNDIARHSSGGAAAITETAASYKAPQKIKSKPRQKPA